MNNNKQTAVEWLIVQLKKVDYNPLEQNGYSKAEERLFEQAKEMEKQQQDLLNECEIQLEYLNQKFGETGTTNALLAKLKNK